MLAVIFIATTAILVTAAAITASELLLLTEVAFVLAAIPAALLIGWLRRRRTRLRVCAAADAGNPPAEILRKLLPTVSVAHTKELLKPLLLKARACAWWGHAVRIQSGKELAIDPVRIPFEPIPFGDYTGTLFLEQLQAPESPDENPKSGPDGHAGVPARLRRAWAAIKQVLWIGLLCVWAAQAIWKIATQWDSQAALFVSGVVALVLLPVLWRLFRPREWLLVPGGLAMRRSRWNSDKWSLHVFDRRKSFLLVCWGLDLHWTAYAIDAEHRLELTGSDFDMQCLLRAWCSPLEPPTAESMSDQH